MRCGLCREEGHDRRKCPQNQGPPPGAAGGGGAPAGDTEPRAKRARKPSAAAIASAASEAESAALEKDRPDDFVTSGSSHKRKVSAGAQSSSDEEQDDEDDDGGDDDDEAALGGPTYQSSKRERQARRASAPATTKTMNYNQEEEEEDDDASYEPNSATSTSTSTATKSSTSTKPLPAKKKRSTSSTSTSSTSSSGTLQRSASLTELVGAADDTRRTAFKADIPKPVRDRLSRAMCQRLFLIEAKPIGSGPEQQYAVLGSTGNVYNVLVTANPSCNCPDAGKGFHCKHLMFVLARVLKVDRKDPILWQTSLRRCELEELHRRMPSRGAGDVAADEAVRKAYRAINNPGSEDAAGEGDGDGNARRKTLEQEKECPICFEDIDSLDNCVWCKTTCGTNVHKECFDNWRRAGKSTCVLCRSEWPSASSTTSVTGVANVNGYMNLSSMSAAHGNTYTPSYLDRAYSGGWGGGGGGYRSGWGGGGGGGYYRKNNNYNSNWGGRRSRWY